MAHAPVRPPALWLLAFDHLALLEWSAFVALAPTVAFMGVGDGHPVLVLPGFTGSDQSTAPLRAALIQKGYGAHGWGLGANVGPHPYVVTGMHRRFEVLHRRYGSKISLIGWSLGGIYARELARRYPDLVRQVITLASPYRMRRGDRGRGSRLFDLVGPRIDGFLPQVDPEECRPPLPVPATSIYTRTDGIVRWHTCIDAVGPGRENIEVRGSHTGMGCNLAAFIAITDRLAQPEGVWTAFRPPPPLRYLFPPAVSWAQ